MLIGTYLLTGLKKEATAYDCLLTYSVAAIGRWATFSSVGCFDTLQSILVLSARGTRRTGLFLTVGYLTYIGNGVNGDTVVELLQETRIGVPNDSFESQREGR